MKQRRKILRGIVPMAVATVVSAVLWGQGLAPALLTEPAVKAWPTYHGDYSGRHYSILDQINQSNVNKLTIQWATRLEATYTGPNFGGEHKDGGPYFFGGPISAVRMNAEPLMVNGILYASAPDHAWALDAHTGHELWHYYWKTSGGHHDGNRGMAMYGNWLFFVTPDCYLVSLNAKDGTERWHKQIADVRQDYWCSPAPVIVRNHLYIGPSGDALDAQGFLEARDPETGDIQWKWYTTPQNSSDPGYDTWPDDYARKHGGGMTWQPPTYDPELNLLYVTTGNANPVFAGQSRKGDNLFANSVVALNADTGKMVWYFQLTPHDTHDWDNTQVPVLFDAVFNGQLRKLLGMAASNGYFFLLDRTNGKSLVTAPFTDFPNWVLGKNSKGQLIPNPEKDPTPDGVLIAPGKATNWPPPTFDPQVGLFITGMAEGTNILYLTDTDPRPEGWAAIGNGQGPIANEGAIRAIDYKTGKIRWSHPLPSNGVQGLLSTAGHLLFGSDTTGNFVAFDPATGKSLWHCALMSNPTNGPETFMLEGRQVIVVGAADTLYAFMLSQ